jgi:hypothetical protein
MTHPDRFSPALKPGALALQVRGVLLLCLLLSPLAASADALSRLVSAAYPDLVAAVTAARELDEPSLQVGIVPDDEAGGYRLVLAESGDPADILAAQRAAERAGLRDLQVVSVSPASPPVTPFGGVAVSSFADREEAHREAAAARARGELAEVGAARQGEGLTSVQLIGYTRRAEAQRVARAIEAAGGDSSVFAAAHERGYVVSAGVFRDEERAREQARRLGSLGYTDVRLVPLRGDPERYDVVTVSPEAAPDRGVITLGPPPTGEGVLILGALHDPAPVFSEAVIDEPGLRYGIDQLRAEAGYLPRSSARADGTHYLHASVMAEWPVAEGWNARLAARVDSYLQTGEGDYERTMADYGDSYIRYRASQRRVTLGTQTVLWGRMDDHAPTDRLSVQDVTRFALDDLQDRRRAVLAARWEEFVGDYKVDMMWVPVFRAAEMPRTDSVWSPIDRSRGRIIGMPDNPILAPFISAGRFAEDDDGRGGWGVRVSRSGRGFDYAFTLQDTRHSLPYYELNPAVRNALLANPDNIPAALGAAPDTFIGRHSRTWVLGGDLGFSTGRSTWRFEAAWLSDHPATTTDLRYVTVKAFDWAGGVEFFPGDTDLRVNMQLGGLHLMESDEELMDRKTAYTLFGDVENSFARNRWRARLRYSVGLGRSDVYVNPEVAFVPREPHEIYLGYHHFSGDEDSLGGFHRHNDLITLGWRARY